MNFINILRNIKSKLIQLNLFESVDSRSNSEKLRNDIISTRLYIILVIITVFVLTLFTALSQKTQTVTIRNPSQEVFQDLYSEYSATLHCPCSQQEIPYATFVNISYDFHPVCSSVFISDSWIKLLFRPDMTYFYPLDFRSSANGQFQLLASFCLFANRTVQQAIDDFLSDALLSPQALSLTSLINQSDARSEFLKVSTTYTFQRLLNLVLETTEMIGLQPAMQTSKMHLITVYPDQSFDIDPLETIWTDINGVECFCGITSNCYSPSTFFDELTSETQGCFYIPDAPQPAVTGFLVGCFALDALLKSSLTCFFNSTCLSTVLTFFPTSNITNLDALDSNQTQYSTETTIETLVNNLLLEHWSLDTSFVSYYSKCAPLLCTYQYAEHNSFLLILTTILGVYGGLTIVLRMCLPSTVRFWRDFKIKNSTQSNLSTRFQRLRNAFRSMKVWLKQLNLFKTPLTRSDPFELQTTIITTRVYIVTMLFATSIIIIYLLSAVRIRTETIENPTRTTFEDLNNKYSSTLQCPCRQIANSYELFISLSPIFHPVCSSLFVSDAWIISISVLNIIDADYDSIDFRVAGPTFFNALATLCSLSNMTIADAWYIFSQTPLVTDSAIIKTEFQIRTKLAIEQFQQNTIDEFKRIFSLVDLHTQTMYTTGYDMIWLQPYESDQMTSSDDMGWAPAETDTCSCALDGQCNDLMSFFHYTGLDTTTPYYLTATLPNLFVGCSVVSSVLRSTLECFFNQTCLDLIEKETKNHRSINISILNVNNTRYSSQAPIETILNDLMVETWNDQIDYDKYYEHCAPEQCTYIYTSRNNPIEVLTKIVGLFGGLSVVLRIIVSQIVRRIRNRMRARRELDNSTDRPSLLRRLIVLWRGMKTKLIEFNMFSSEQTWDDNQRSRREIITTRIYLLLLTTAVMILIIYTLIDTQNEIVKVLNPSEDKFDALRLHPQYSATLDCPCQNITVPYQSFISIQPYYHQVCSSDFVTNSSSWIHLLYSFSAGIDYSYDNYRLFAPTHFTLLASLCKLANDTVSEAIDQFLTNVIINERVQSRESIQIQVDSILDRFILSTPQVFVRTLDFIRYMAQGNGIVSSILSNWHFVTLHTDMTYDALWALPYSYGDSNCTCGTSSTCISQASFDGFVVPGLHVGCYPLETFLQSTLECLYSISCINQLKSMYNADSNIIFNPLNASLSSPNTTVQSLVDNLLIEDWKTKVIYEQYYTTCSPLWCSYTYTERINPLYTVTTIIGFYGGLTVALKLITPILVQIGSRILRYRHRRILPIVTELTVENLDKY